MIEVSEKTISPETVINKVKNERSGCVAAYIGLIRNNSQGKSVLSVEYQDSEHNAGEILQQIAGEVRKKWPIEDIAISHRTGILKVGEINLAVAVSSAHRTEGFAACQYVIDRFKDKLPTKKTERYQDGSELI
ncbi:MAG: molybdenum cofactor biosynthesis protein MoaE [Dehalococcoidales bacterium]|jgi:molybdopterin synthase catalytic subunit